MTIALGCLACAERPVLRGTAPDALIRARAAEADPSRATAGQNALLLAAAVLHLLLWGAPVLPSQAGTA